MHYNVLEEVTEENKHFWFPCFFVGGQTENFCKQTLCAYLRIILVFQIGPDKNGK